MQLAKKACWRRPNTGASKKFETIKDKDEVEIDKLKSESRTLLMRGNPQLLEKPKDAMDNFIIERKFPRKIYLREPGELTQQLVSIASGGKSYESSHNCYYGQQQSRDSEDDDINARDRMPETPKTQNSRRTTKRLSYLPVFNTKKQPNETYEQMKQRVFLASTNHLDDMLDFSKLSANHSVSQANKTKGAVIASQRSSQGIITPNSVSFGPSQLMKGGVQLKQSVFKQYESGQHTVQNPGKPQQHQRPQTAKPNINQKARVFTNLNLSKLSSQKAPTVSGNISLKFATQVPPSPIRMSSAEQQPLSRGQSIKSPLQRLNSNMNESAVSLSALLGINQSATIVQDKTAIQTSIVQQFNSFVESNQQKFQDKDLASALGQSQQLRRSIHRYIEEIDSKNPQTKVEKGYAFALKGTIKQLKNECEDKLRTVNVDCPKVWDLRQSLKDRMTMYSSKVIERKDAEERTRASILREEQAQKSLALQQKIDQEQELNERQKAIYVEKKTLKIASNAAIRAVQRYTQQAE
ncbi:hypothetical protein FGO68_gene3081 [Halteria grandinella]|uniref:Uncharacterized protein n=1 Tax=Halteria grandinella TaxID=5974 RepID=A0A8J8NS64_HALGN|nr:hypothetical protein FGO68_gene3081 [Halteria grandinella]